MPFLFPWFLVAALAIGIPIAIHLFHFRRYKTILFPDLRFLKSVYTEQKNRNRLKHLLTLIARCLAIISLVLAFSIPSCKKNASVNYKKQVAIFIDNSLSMSQTGTGEMAFETAKNRARNVVKQYGNNAVFRILGHQLSEINAEYSNAEDAMKIIDNLSVTAASETWEDIWKEIFQSTAVAPDEAFWISDFQSVMIPANPKFGNEKKIYGIQIERKVMGNISLDSAWIVNPMAIPGEKNSLGFTVKNFDKTRAQSGIRLSIDGEVAAISTVTVPAGETATGFVDFVTPADRAGLATLSLEDDGYQFDNTLFLNLGGTSFQRVFNAGPNKYIDSALRKNRFLQINPVFNTSGNGVHFYPLGSAVSQDVNSLKSRLSQGAVVVIYPDRNTSEQQWHKLQTEFGLPKLKRAGVKVKLDKDDLKNPFFKGVFSTFPEMVEMPVVQNYWSAGGSIGNAERILGLENGDPFLVRFSTGKGYLYVFLADLSENAGNFYASFLFFPVISNCVIAHTGTFSLYGNLNSETGYPLRSRNEVGEAGLLARNGTTEVIAEIQQGLGRQELYIGDPYRRPGFWSLSSKGKILEHVALNYSRRESNPSVVTDEQKSNLENAGVQWISSNSNGIEVASTQSEPLWWRLFIWFAAAFFALEVLILSFWDRVFRAASPITTTE